MKTFAMLLLLFTLALLSSGRVDCGSVASRRVESCSREGRRKYADTRDLLPSVVDLNTIHAVHFLLEKFHNQPTRSFVSSVEYAQYSRTFQRRYYSSFAIKSARLAVRVNRVTSRIGADALDQLRLQLDGVVCDWLRERMKTAVAVLFACELENEAGDPNEYLGVHLGKVARLNLFIRKRLLLIGGAAMRQQYEARLDKCVLQPLGRAAKPLAIHLPEPTKASSAAASNGNEKVKSQVVARQGRKPANPTPSASYDELGPLSD